MDIEDLMNIKVTSVSKREQKLSQTAAAVFLITQEDIRRSGAANIPDLLRMVPGLDVAQINMSTWAITSRGFNGQFSNKLLVLIDGRTVYDPSFSGVYWEVQDTLLEDVDRIEVIRGPGAAVWGSNAVNGVINITTKAAKDTQGGLMTGSMGSGEQSGSARYGARIGSRAYYRAYGRHLNRASSDDISAQGMADGFRIDRGGFRLDWAPTDRDTATAEGEIYLGRSNNPYLARSTAQGYLPPYSVGMELGGGHLLARWNHTFAAGSQLSVQMYADRLTRVDPVDPELRTTIDFDMRHHMTMGRHEIVWGMGYRHNWDRLSGGPSVYFTPKTFQASIINGFVHDEMTVVEGRLWFTLGGKLEHNVYTGLETEPTASLMWALNSRNSVWGSVARATRIPARNDTDIYYDLPSFTTPEGQRVLIGTFGNPQFQSEKLTAYEVGYRAEPVSRLWIDLTAFRNSYKHLRTLEAGAPTFVTAAPTPYLFLPLTDGNKMFGNTLGAEGFLEWKATNYWSLRGGYTWFQASLRQDPTSTDTVLLAQNQGNTPRNQIQVRSLLNLPRNFEWDVAVYRVGRLATGSISAYSRLDTRLGWRPGKHFDLGIVGQNLLSPGHFEFNQPEQKVLGVRIERSLHCRVTWHF